MISNELYKRVFTSLVLLPILIICIFFNKYVFLVFLIFIGIVSSYEWYLMNKKKNLLTFFLGFSFLLISIISSFILRGNDNESIFFFTWILFVCFFSDIGGYIFGKIIGGKRWLKISPNKTVGGTIGSIIFSFCPILIINYQTFFVTSLKININTLVLTLIVSLICQLGDIIISYFKRLRNLKDTGNILPGHGGFLDRIDGIIFVLPAVLFIKFFNLI